MIIQRHLGFKNLIAKSGQWEVCPGAHSECWYCSQHLLTLFIWTPRISQLAQVKDEQIRQYYKDTIDLLTETDPEFQPIKTGEIPHIIGPFTNWKYHPMRAVVPFCQQQDTNPPDFLTMAIEQGLLPETCAHGKD